MEHDTAMPSGTHTQRVLDLASRKGLLRASDLDAIDAPRVVLTRLIVNQRANLTTRQRPILTRGLS